MALEEYAGPIILYLDSSEIEVRDISVTQDTGRKLVKTMNSTGMAKGFAKGVITYELDISVVIPLTGDIDWSTIQGSKISIFPLTPGGQIISYQNCFTISVGDKYSMDSEAMRDIKMAALNKVYE